MTAALVGVALLATACSHAAAPPTTTTTTTKAPTTSTSTAKATTTTTTAVTTTTSAGTASIGPLVTRNQPAGTYSVSLPAAWQFADTSIPSDHQTNVWSDPSDTNSMLTVVLSGCVGCAETSPTQGTPDPQNLLPAGATVTQSVLPWQIYYSAPASASGYTDFGMIMVTHNGSAVSGYVRLDFVVTSGQAATANMVLSSFSLT